MSPFVGPGYDGFDLLMRAEGYGRGLGFIVPEERGNADRTYHHPRSLGSLRTETRRESPASEAGLAGVRIRGEGGLSPGFIWEGWKEYPDPSDQDGSNARGWRILDG